MTYPVFASGDVLNASDMNAVGLWLVKTQTIGSAVSSVQVTGAFTSDYENYLILLTGGVTSTAVDLTIQLGSTTTGYYAGGYYVVYSASTITGHNQNNAANLRTFAGTTNSLDGIVYVLSPQLAKRTTIHSQYARTATTGFIATMSGFVDTATQYTDFTIASGAATMTGGTIRVYGFRN